MNGQLREPKSNNAQTHHIHTCPDFYTTLNLPVVYFSFPFLSLLRFISIISNSHGIASWGWYHRPSPLMMMMTTTTHSSRIQETTITLYPHEINGTCQEDPKQIWNMDLIATAIFFWTQQNEETRDEWGLRPMNCAKSHFKWSVGTTNKHQLIRNVSRHDMTHERARQSKWVEKKNVCFLFCVWIEINSCRMCSKNFLPKNKMYLLRGGARAKLKVSIHSLQECCSRHATSQ